MTKRLFLFGFSFFLLFAAYFTLSKRIDPLQYDFYILSWWGYIFFAEGLLTKKTRGSFVINRGLPRIIILSCGFWCLFEIINIRLENWFYINLPASTLHRYTGYLIAYGTVIPAITVTKSLMGNVFTALRTKKITFPAYSSFSLIAGIIMLILIIIFPVYLFPLAWIFLTFIIDGYNYRKGYRSFMKDLEEGKPGELYQSLIAGLLCGILWEFWNYWSITKWVYTVPFFEGGKIFEMPLAGYLGFPVFGVETIALTRFLDGIRPKKTVSRLIIVVSLFISFVAFPLIDRYTVSSFAPKINQLFFLSPIRIEGFQRQGVKTSFGINPENLTRDERESVRMTHLKGLGTVKLMALSRNGIHTVCDLARLDIKNLAAILNEKNLRRVKIYIDAAREECKKTPSNSSSS